MRLAILSDVHSNMHALEAVLKAVDHLGVEMIVCAGDIVGYCAFPNECCEIIKARVSKIVEGNHDRAVIERNPSGANPYAARAIMWTAGVINKDSREFLTTLCTESRFPLAGRSIVMFHGSPTSVDEYVFEYDADEELVKSADADVLILGHTHVPCIKKLTNGMFINPGAVGQPRDRDWMASFAVLDAETNDCAIKRVPYDVAAAADAIRKAGLPEFLAQRLHRGE